MDDATTQTEIELLMLEIRRYLDTVAAFRRAGCEPRWAREPRPLPGLATASTATSVSPVESADR